MGKKLFGCMTVFFLALILCVSFAQHSYAYTTVYLDSVDGPLADIASLQFDILSPVAADVASFTPSLPGDWLNMSTPGSDTFNAFSMSSSLPLGKVGVFNIDVTLGKWVIGNQSAVSLVEGTDYLISQDGTNYRITSAVPIPGALWLLGSGLLGFVTIRRRRG